MSFRLPRPGGRNVILHVVVVAIPLLIIVHLLWIGDASRYLPYHRQNSDASSATTEEHATPSPSQASAALPSPTLVAVNKNLKPSKFHYLVFASQPNLSLCYLLVSSAANRYPPPVFIGWNKTEEHLDAQLTHLAKLRNLHAWLERMPAEADNDIALAVDGYDVIMQLPPEVMLPRYFATNGEADKIIADRLGISTKEAADRGRKQTVILGADKVCFPPGDQDTRCWATPENPLGRDSYGPDTDKTDDATFWQPRWLNSGTVMGNIADMRDYVAGTLQRINQTFDPEYEFHNSDQYYMGNLYADQEYFRTKEALEVKALADKLAAIPADPAFIDIKNNHDNDDNDNDKKPPAAAEPEKQLLKVAPAVVKPVEEENAAQHTPAAAKLAETPAAATPNKQRLDARAKAIVPGGPSNRIDPVATPGVPTEFHVGLDYTSSLYQLRSFNEPFVRIAPFDQAGLTVTLDANIQQTPPSHFTPALLRMPEDVRVAMTRIYESLPESDRASVDTPTWLSQLRLGVNQATRQVWGLWHQTGDKESLGIWYRAHWMYGSLTRALLDSTTRVMQESQRQRKDQDKDAATTGAVLTVDKQGREWVAGTEIPVSETGPAGGGWSDDAQAEWFNFEYMCGEFAADLFPPPEGYEAEPVAEAPEEPAVSPSPAPPSPPASSPAPAAAAAEPATEERSNGPPAVVNRMVIP